MNFDAMKQLLDGKFAPLTHAWGFLEAPLQLVGDALCKWTRSNVSKVTYESFEGSLIEALLRLEPLTMPPRRKLLMQTASDWTAYFDNGSNGGDPASAVGYMAEYLKCRGLAVACVPQTLMSERKDAKGTYGAVQFQLFAPEPREFLNYERSISVANDGGRWVFNATGAVQPYEKPANYEARGIRNRFTPEILEEYCAALGIRLFAVDFYGRDAMLIKVHDPLPPHHPVLTLTEARMKIGLQ
jgi:hypothetical protein